MAVILEQEFIQLLTRRGMIVLSGGGYPDLIVYDPQRRSFIFAEIKDVGDEVRPNQEQVHKAMKQVGCDVRIWRRTDLESMAREFDLSQTLEARANPSRAPKTFLYELSRLKEQVGWLREEIARLASEAKKIFLGFENLDDNMWRSSYKASPIDFFRSMEENIDKLSKEFAETSAETERFHSELLAIMAGRAVGPSVPLSLTKSPEQMRLVDDDEPIN